jgi:hypothetical protein
MKFNSNWKIIFFGILSIILLIAIYKYFKLDNHIQKSINETDIMKILTQENFCNNNESYIPQSDNLIINGHFYFGNGIKQEFDKEGYQEIIVFKNPGDSSYSLKQSQVIQDNQLYKKSYYGIQLNIQNNKFYEINLWFANDKDWDGSDSLLNINFPRFNDEGVFLNSNGNVIEKRMVDGLLWQKIRYRFQAPSNTTGIMKLYLGFNPKNTKGFRYITGVFMREFLENSRNFEITNGLMLYIDAGNSYSYNGSGLIVKDLSNQGNDMIWKYKPKFDRTGYFDTTGNILTGPLMAKLDINDYDKEKEFSIVFGLRYNKDSVDYNNELNEEEEEINNDFTSTLFMPGNNNIGLEVSIPNKYDNIKLRIGDMILTTKMKIIPDSRSIVIITFGQGILKIYLNGVLLEEFNIGNIYFSNGQLIVNKDMSWNGLLSSLLIYNRKLVDKEIKIMDRQYICEKKNETELDLSNYIMNMILPNQKESCNKDDIDRIDYLDNIRNLISQMNIDDSKPLDTCKKEKTCRIQFKDLPCQWVLMEDGKTGGNGDVPRGRCGFVKNDSFYECDEGCCLGETKIDRKQRVFDDDDNCPIVYENKNGEYIVVVKKNSSCEKRYNYAGERSYGTDRIVARRIYERNFPDCKVPDILIDEKYVGDINRTPFVMHELNPGRYIECRDVDWNGPVKNINKQCRMRIDNYCRVNSEYDASCYCWRPDNMHKDDCKKFLGKFEDISKCDIGKMDIEKHPDMRKYVRKDRVPCWGCDLSEKSCNKKK